MPSASGCRCHGLFGSVASAPETAPRGTALPEIVTHALNRSLDELVSDA
ncbi:hypothetical protein ACQEVB_28955 [Pseudonocardia sp. CA-107938]